MRVSKEQALELVKLLERHNHAAQEWGSILVELQHALEQVVLYGDDEEGEDDDEKAADDDEEEEGAAGAADEEDAAGAGEDKEPAEGQAGDRLQDEEESELDADRAASTGDLCRLKGIKVRTGIGQQFGTLAFERCGQAVDLHASNGVCSVFNVTYLKRFAKELHVRDDRGTWSVFKVSKLDRAWTKLLPLEELVEVDG
jgi:hypothetical protein